MADKIAKVIPWAKVKAEYLNGVKPKELSAKYQISLQTIYNKINIGKWKNKKEQFSIKLEQSMQDSIKGLATKALEKLDAVLTSSTDDKDIIAAARAILDVSGLKASKTMLQTDNNFSLFYKNIENKAKIIENGEK